MLSTIPSILPLPPEVAAQIKSSTTINSLSIVVLGLLANSLDADARRVDINVDLRRGAASVEDDGNGIPPKEFHEYGGLGKPHHTSKNNSLSVAHGRNGTFLTSVAALSILSITSHHRTHPPHATLILHHSRPAARLIPAPSHQHLSNREHGTKVSVQDLFGNMPVRVKQRTKVAELGKEDEKQLEILRKQIVGMLLAWDSPVSVTLKNAESSKKMTIRGKQTTTTSVTSEDSPFRKLDVLLICSILSQAGFIEPSDWDTWVKTSARTPLVTIQGAISLQPAPAKQVQFVSIGIRPINREMGGNILYDEINKLFALSSFGSQEDVSDVEDDTKARKRKDGRFKKDGFTDKQLRGRGKGVDRWPMFYIRLDIQNTKLYHEDDVDRLGEGIISSLIEVLRAMITTFLDENHFRPRARLGRRKQTISTKPAAMGRSLSSGLSSATTQGAEVAHFMYPDHNFGTWSRIKTGMQSKSSGASPFLSSLGFHASAAKGEFSRAVDLPKALMSAPQGSEVSSTTADDPVVDHGDEQTLVWRNPSSGAIVLVNARTGLVVPLRPHARPASAPSEHSSSSSSQSYASTIHGSYSNKRLTRRASNPCITPKEGTWSSELLKKWENPVFETTEESIPQVSFDGPSVETSDVLHGRRHCCSDLDIQKAFTQSSASCSAKLSKQGLNAARVISQVDKKFILVCVNRSPATYDREDAELLVLVDQHAADERVRVEDLLADLKSSPTLLPKPLIFEVQAREQRPLSRLALSFAALGIVYKLSAAAGSTKCRVIVKALPGAIAERCRLEPRVLIELIRSESWKCEDGEGSLATKACPQGLLDMLNSRACRSAIMFNDELTKEECRTLIQRLGKCAFPFQCAHGRPTMVPLVNLGAGASLGIGKQAFGSQKTEMDMSNEDGGFGAAWRVWKSDG
ncbi:MAG: DNA mismatch repair protein [Alectoria fallacina]|uniref:DNA mismatch repair protein n=1 Tax=Alectoria fallacina TaxID=1903189 RepID=A0A8H3EZU9_9LECA|nr:MAG: DNA mismatch repair protein [Alectoria fallacina]